MDRLDLPADDLASSWLNRASPFLVMTLIALSTWAEAVLEDGGAAPALIFPVLLSVLGLAFSSPAASEHDAIRHLVRTQVRGTLFSAAFMAGSLFYGFAPWYWLVPATVLVGQTFSVSPTVQRRFVTVHAAVMGVEICSFIIAPLAFDVDTGITSYSSLAAVLTSWSTTYVTRRRIVRLASAKRDEKERQIELLLARAERANETSQYIVASVSHEMRTPLASVLGFSQMARRILNEAVMPAIADDPTASRKAKRADENLKIVESEARRMTGIVNVLLDHHDLTSGTVDWGDGMVATRPVMVSALTDILKILPSPPPFKLKVDIPKDLPNVRGNEERLRECLTELLINAVKFTPAGLIVFSAGHTKSEVWIRVEDSGHGIDSELIDEIFMPFNQAKRLANTDKPDGTGLGLAFVKSVVEGHGGRIEVVSTPGEGSTFTIHLPVAEVRSDASPTNPEVQSGSTKRITRTTNPAAWVGAGSPSEASGSWDLQRIRRDLASHQEVIILDAGYAMSDEPSMSDDDALPADEDTDMTEEEDVTDTPTFEFDASAPPVLVMDESRTLSNAWRQALVHSGVNALVVPPAQLVTTTQFWLQQPSVLTLTLILGDCNAGLEASILRDLEEMNAESGRLCVISVSQRTSEVRKRCSAILLNYEKPIALAELTRVATIGR